MPDYHNTQAAVLFFIVVAFLVCNVPRIVLNCYEVFTVESFRANVDNECYRLPMWVMTTTLLSLLLMIVNSSINFFVYCLVNATFRQELLNRWPWCKVPHHNHHHNHQSISVQSQRMTVVATNEGSKEEGVAKTAV